MSNQEIFIPPAYAFLFEDAPYKVAYGGRGSGKSHSIARALLVQAAQERHRVLCCRELQGSIKDSVHKLLSDIIDSNDALRDFYTVQQATIVGRNGSEFVFAGLRHNASEIKSFEGCTRVWVEEAQVVSKGSWEVLLPTVMRTPTSQVWIGMNPRLETDDSYQRWIVSPPPGAIVRKLNWDQNPLFPEGLRAQMEHSKATNPDQWMHVWEGHPMRVLDGAIYADEIRAMDQEGRITSVPITKDVPLESSWDLGYSDMTSIWVWQKVGMEIRVVGFYQNRHKDLAHYIAWLKSFCRGKVGTAYLPHDANHSQLSAAGKTIAAQVRDMDVTVRVLPNLRIADGIQQVRSMFPRVFIDATECSVGVDCLRRYRYDVNTEGNYSLKPKHDDSSHGADAFRMLAVAYNGSSGKSDSTNEQRAARVLAALNMGGMAPTGWGAI